MNEFALIQHFFKSKVQHVRDDVTLGIGDDCAILSVPVNHALLVSTDTLVSGVHFFADVNPYDLGYKSLAVNLSDLAAMGATPAWASLSLTLPAIDEVWLEAFSQGFFDLVNEFQVQLIGGDTTKGPLSITIQVHGFAPCDASVTRSGAQVSDLIYVTNCLGDAGLALKHRQNQLVVESSLLDVVLARMDRPHPRVKEGLLARPYASAMIDISDGLVSDLGHILKQSNVGALLNLDAIPLSKALTCLLTKPKALEMALSAGDDYELCLTVPTKNQQVFEEQMMTNGCKVSLIGAITESRELAFLGNDQLIDVTALQGYMHF